jgi:hypothetical protein
MISIPLARFTGFAVAAIVEGLIGRADVELPEVEACALVKYLVSKLPPNQRGKLLATLASEHRRGGEAARPGG